jgi:molecular chaperone DnaJ
MLRMKGLGLPELNGTLRGDQYVRVVVWTPDELTPEQEALMRKLRAIETAAPAEVRLRAQKGFWSRVKEAFTGG